MPPEMGGILCEVTGVKCPNCGHEIPDKANVCPVCGKYFMRIKPKAVCSNCGAEVPDGATVCPGCGRPVRRRAAGERGENAQSRSSARKTARPKAHFPKSVLKRRMADPGTARAILIAAAAALLIAGFDVWTMAGGEFQADPARLAVTFLLLFVVLTVGIAAALIALEMYLKKKSGQ